MTIYSITQGTPYFRTLSAAAKYYAKQSGAYAYKACAVCGEQTVQDYTDQGSGMDLAISKVQAGEIYIGQPEREDDEIRRWWDEDGRLTIQYHAHALPEVG